MLPCTFAPRKAARLSDTSHKSGLGEQTLVGGAAKKINSQVVLLLGWGRAILLQLAHPLVACAIADHSSFRMQRLRRLHRTLSAMLALTFGDSEEVALVARTINAAHDRVRGRLRETAGPFAAGTVYSARDPALLRWVHATLLDSFLRTYELYAGPLAPEEKDQYCAEASCMEPLLGIPTGYLPRSVEELQSYMDQMLASGEITVTETARELAREIVSPAIPCPRRPLAWLLYLPTVGLLPSEIREAYGFPWASRHELGINLSAELARTLRSFTPSSLRQWPSALKNNSVGATETV